MGCHTIFDGRSELWRTCDGQHRSTVSTTRYIYFCKETHIHARSLLWGSYVFSPCVQNVFFLSTTKKIKRLLRVYVHQYFCDDALNTPNFSLSSLPTFYIPDEGSLQYYKVFLVCLGGGRCLVEVEKQKKGSGKNSKRWKCIGFFFFFWFCVSWAVRVKIKQQQPTCKKKY